MKEGDKTGMDGWMDVAMVITLDNQQAHVLYCHSRPNSLYDNK